VLSHQTQLRLCNEGDGALKSQLKEGLLPALARRPQLSSLDLVLRADDREWQACARILRALPQLRSLNFGNDILALPQASASGVACTTA